MAYLVRALKGIQMLKVGQRVRILPYVDCPDHGPVITHAFSVGEEVHILASDPFTTDIPVGDVPPGMTPWDTDGDFRCMRRSDERANYVHHSQLKVID